MFVSCVHPVVVLNAAFYLTRSLLMLRIQEATMIMEEAYSTAGLMTVLLVVMSVFFCLHYSVTVSAFYHL